MEESSSYHCPFTIYPPVTCDPFMIIDLYAKTDVGRVRRGNEDNYLLLDLTSGKAWTGSDGAEPPTELHHVELGEKGVVFVVSDGMGGALAGDVASRIAVE